jgi:tRNA A-37 threonylcarbamoyl transferase component Bud32/tetratricopeptide (TPR) repeat protein
MDLDLVRKALGERFEIERELGRGAMAVVYLAHDRGLDRRVAIKVLRPDLIDTQSAERFLREIRIEGRLQHPNIVPIYESGRANSVIYYVMPFVSGETLKERLSRQGPLDIDEAVGIAKEVTDALVTAHEQGTIHRDVKPGNILLSSGHAVLADFGVARALVESVGESLTSAGVAVGTPTYMSPEQADGDGRVDERSDIYALGCVLFEMLAGEPPFTGRTTAAIMAKHCAEPVPSLEVVRPGLPPGLLTLVRRTLAKVPADRFPDARRLREALDTSLTSPGDVKHRRGRRLARAAGAFAVGASCIGAAYLWLAARPAPVGLDPARVAVFPFVDRSEADAGPLDIDHIIGNALDHTEPLRWINSWNALTPEQREHPRTLSSRDYRRMSHDLGAGFYITGQIVRRIDSVFVALQLYDVRGDSLVDDATGAGPLGVISESQAALAALRFLVPHLVDPGRSVDLGPFANRSPAALTSWLQGEREYRLSRFPEALEFYRRSLEDDSLMIFAAVKGALAANWSHQPDRAAELIERAVRTDAPMPARHRLFIAGLSAYLAGAADSAIDLLGGATRADPDWPEAWMLLGEIHQHLMPEHVSADSAVAYFRKAAEDRGFTPPLIHLAEHAIAEGQNSEAKRMIRDLEAAAADPLVVNELRTMQKCVADGPDAVDFATLAKTDAETVYDVSMLLSAGALQADCAIAGFEALLKADAWATAYSWAAARGLQGLYIAKGDATAATRLLASIVESAPSAHTAMLQRSAPAAMFLAILDSAAGTPMPSLTAQMETTARTRYGNDYENIRGIRTPYLLGNWHALKGETGIVATIREHLLEAAAAPAVVESDSATRRRRDSRFYADVLTAHLTLMTGDTANAIRQLEQLRPIATIDQVQNSEESSLAPERLLLSQLCLARGDYVRAHEIAAAFDHQGPLLLLPFIPASLRIRHQAALALDDSRLAARYARRLKALGQTDPEAR